MLRGILLLLKSSCNLWPFDVFDLRITAGYSLTFSAGGIVYLTLCDLLVSENVS
jgi:hypothetical protein